MGLVKLPVLDLAAVEEYLLNVAPKAVVKGHDAVRVRTHVCDVGTAGVLPRCLPRQDQVCVVAAQDACEDEEEDENDHEDHKNCLHMVFLPTLDVVLRVGVIYRRLVAGCKG